MSETEKTKDEDFSSKMLDILNNSMLCLMISIGYKTQLFEVMSKLPPSSSQEIAEAARLNERYVREWLAAMVTGCIVNYDHEMGKYNLPTAHAALLTQKAGPDNLARIAQVIPFLASVEKDIATCFVNGGGVPYLAYTDFMKMWAEANAERFEKTLVQKILPLIPDTIEKLRAGIDVLDVGCGDGSMLSIMAKPFPKSHFTGYDFLESSINTARVKAKSLALKNLHFERKDIITVDESKKYDLITAFDAIHDMAKPLEVLQAIARLLTPGGTFLMADIAASSHLQDNLDHPMGTWLYTTSCMHCMTTSLEQGGAGLGTMWGEQKALEMLKEAGFAHIDVHKIPEDPFNNYYVATIKPTFR